MMALQKSLLEQSDIVPTLRGFEFKVSEGEELVVNNPPISQSTKKKIVNFQKKKK